MGEAARRARAVSDGMAKLAVLFLGFLAVAAPAGAARVPGEQSNAFTGQTSRLVFRGRFRTATLELDGRLRCRPGGGGCPARVGRMATSCVDNGGSYRCTGTITYASLTCTVDGYYYTPFAFEAVYECPSTVGSLSIRKP
jgi:hypothetical protein